MRAHAGFPISAPCSCAEGGEMCEECQQNQAAIHRRASASAAPSHVPRIVSDVLRSPGHPLDSATRAFFEPRFGHDFSGVRVHTGPEAAASALSIDATAYAAGPNIVFAPGQYTPESGTGKLLIAHELTHVVQQQRGAVAATRNTFGIQVGANSNFGCIGVQRQTAAPTAAIPGLGPSRTAEVDQLIQDGDRQGAIDMLINYKYMDYEIEKTLLDGGTMTFLDISDDGRTSPPGWDDATGKARPSKVYIGPGAFSSVAYLYSVIMHEYQHVLQNQSLARQTGGQAAANLGEVEASAWELLHATETGLAALPDKIAQVWEQLNSFYWKLDDKQRAKSLSLAVSAQSAAKKFAGSGTPLVPFKPPATFGP